VSPALEIAFLNAAEVMDPAAFAFAVAAIDVQIQRDFLPAWRGYLPIEDPVVCAGYSSAANLAPGSFAPIDIVASLGDAGTQGDHSGFGPAKLAYGRSKPIPNVMSHEALELLADRYADRWVELADDLVVAFEVCDMVENDSYPITVTIGGDTQAVLVSNFAYPAWFGEGDGERYDHMGLCRHPMDNRGYVIVQDDDGTIRNVFADRAGAAYKAAVGAKLTAATRTARRFDTKRPGTLMAMRELGTTEF